MAAEVLVERGRSIRSIAKDFRVDESTLRYRLGRRQGQVEDGRRRQPEICADWTDVILAWAEEQSGRAEGKRDPVRALYEQLVSVHGYRGSYKAVVRYLRRRQGVPTDRPIRRVEVRAGSQAQIDWFEDIEVWIGALGGAVTLAAFVMTLSHSRMFALIWSLRQDMLSWIRCHNEAFARLGGIPLSGRIDNLKTGVASGAGAWAVLNEGYESYASQTGFIIDPCRVRRGSDKGKVERRGRDCLSFLTLLLERRYMNVPELQRATDQLVAERAATLCCPLTGRSILESWLQEREHLRPLPPTLPEPFDLQVARQVGRDCLVHFEGRAYQAPNAFLRRQVLVRGCAGTVEILALDGRVLCRYPRGTDCRILLDQSLYDAEGDDRVRAATPLGRLGRAIVLERSWEAPRRTIDAYVEVVGGVR